MEDSNNIRNFVIIAHIDAGKSTLADRMLELTGTVEARKMKPQYLDQLELERERGITIKMAPVRMLYKHSSQIRADINADKRGLLYEDLTYRIRAALFNVYNALGPSYKENIYGNAFEEELKKIKIPYEREKIIDVIYRDKKVGNYRPDFIIDEKVILEFKAQPFIGKLEIKQTWHYLKGSHYRLALLVNFGSRELQIERIVYDTIRDNPRLGQRESAQVEYILNLIDTPGHSDFSYEVSRALAAVEGAILLVDAAKGIQAQTLSNFRMAKNVGLKIIGAVNKIDLKPPQLERNADALAALLEVRPDEVLRVSAKTGEGVKELLEAIVHIIPAPVSFPKDRGSFSSRTISGSEIEMGERVEKLSGRPLDEVVQGGNFSQGASRISRTGAGSGEKLPRALIFDSLYDDHKGILAFLRVFDGEFKAGEEIFLAASGTKLKVKEAGYFTPELKPAARISAGEIGYIATGVKEPELVKIGDTIINADKRGFSTRINADNISENPRDNPRESASWVLPGYKEPAPVVFVSFYPDEKTKFEDLKAAFDKLRLTDSSLSFEPDSSEALGRGLKVGFLGQLHFEIAASRLKREFGLSFLTSFPSIAYRVKKDGIMTVVKDPHEFPDSPEKVFQPVIRVELFTPPAYLSQIMALKEIFYLEIEEVKTVGEQAVISGTMPLAELLRDFDDKLKSASAGFASFSYELAGEAPADVEKLEILVNGEPIPALTRIVFKAEAEKEGRAAVERLKDRLPRQQFSQPLQARARGRIIARETIPALRKDVTGYLYGGDRTRKMKLWKKQKAGKEKLKERARVSIPPEVFRELLKK